MIISQNCNSVNPTSGEKAFNIEPLFAIPIGTKMGLAVELADIVAWDVLIIANLEKDFTVEELVI